MRATAAWKDPVEYDCRSDADLNANLAECKNGSESKLQTCGLTADLIQHPPANAVADWICGQNLRTDADIIFQDPRNSATHSYNDYGNLQKYNY